MLVPLGGRLRLCLVLMGRSAKPETELKDKGRHQQRAWGQQERESGVGLGWLLSPLCHCKQTSAEAKKRIPGWTLQIEMPGCHPMVLGHIEEMLWCELASLCGEKVGDCPWWLLGTQSSPFMALKLVSLGSVLSSLTSSNKDRIRSVYRIQISKCFTFGSKSVRLLT